MKASTQFGIHIDRLAFYMAAAARLGHKDASEAARKYERTAAQVAFAIGMGQEADGRKFHIKLVLPAYKAGFRQGWLDRTKGEHAQSPHARRKRHTNPKTPGTRY